MTQGLRGRVFLGMPTLKRGLALFSSSGGCSEAADVDDSLFVVLICCYWATVKPAAPAVEANSFYAIGCLPAFISSCASKSISFRLDEAG